MQCSMDDTLQFVCETEMTLSEADDRRGPWEEGVSSSACKMFDKLSTLPNMVPSGHFHDIDIGRQVSYLLHLMGLRLLQDAN
jgi:hypothetical protein